MKLSDRLVVFVAAFVVYWMTLAPTVYVGDTGELLAAAHGLGIPHPTGYPLYLLAVKAFATLVPLENFAFRANLFSALCAAAAAQILASSFWLLFSRRWLAVSLGLAFAFVEPIWSQAVVARTYSLAALFSTGLLWCAVRWWKDPHPRWWFRHNLLLGFALANHPMVIAHVLAFGALVIFHRRDECRHVRALLLSGLCVIPGGLVYGYLPLRASADPAVEYHVPIQTATGGHQFGDLATFSNLKSYLTREFHHGQRWMESPTDVLRIAGHHLALSRELWLGLPLLLIGLWRRIRSKRAWLGFVGLLWLGNLGPLAWHGAWWDIFLYPRYMTVSWVGLLVLVGFGADWITRSAESSGARWLGPVVAAAVPTILLTANFARCDRSEHALAEDYAYALLQEIPVGAQFGTAADNALYPMMYLHFVESVRPDLRIVNEVQLGGSTDLTQPIYSPDLTSPYPQLMTQPVGLTSRFVPAGTPQERLQDLDVPAIRGLDGEYALDAISASVVGQIHADLARAQANRGQLEDARASMVKVLEFDAGRPWGAQRAAQLGYGLAARNMGADGNRELARQDLDLADRLVQHAADHGDPRDSMTRLLQERGRGYRELLQASELLTTNPEQGFGHLERAMALLPHEIQWQTYYLQVLAQRGKQAEAKAHLDKLLQTNPGHPGLMALRGRL